MEDYPCGRSCHTATFCNDHMVVFGGKEESRKSIVNKLLIYSFKQDKWINPKIEGKKPEPRMGHTACIYHDFIIFYGGWSGGKVLKDFSVIDLSNGFDKIEFVSIEDLPVFGETSENSFTPEDECQPSPRQFHSANIIGDKIFIFGGGDGRNWINELHVFDLNSKKWYKPKVQGEIPEARLQHSSFVYQNKLYIFGGEPDQESTKEIKLRDCYYLDTTIMKWSKVDMNKISLPESSILSLSSDKNESSTQELSSEISPYTRISATATVINNSVFIFGGYDGLNWYNELYCLNLETNKLRIARYDDHISSRCRHTAVARETAICYEICLYAGNNEFKSLNDIKIIKIPLDFETINVEIKPSVSPQIPECSISRCDLTKAFCDSYLNNKYTDIKFKIKDEYFSGHSIFCATKSNFFREKIEKAMNNSSDEPNIDFNLQWSI